MLVKGDKCKMKGYVVISDGLINGIINVSYNMVIGKMVDVVTDGDIYPPTLLNYVVRNNPLVDLSVLTTLCDTFEEAYEIMRETIMQQVADMVDSIELLNGSLESKDRLDVDDINTQLGEYFKPN